ncbi:MAG: polyphosphate polymerase domain-containing protein [Rhodothermales bacterium]|nr:polyphosphate polymerase domain-containing protein [Rhodothermales bacterium]
MRHELKYLIPLEALDSLRQYVAWHTGRDLNARDDGRYTVRSVYFDTSRGAMYRAKKEGERRRMKVRVRGYNTILPADTVTLELKRKESSTAWKRKARMPLGEAEDWLTGLRDLPETDDVDAANTFRYFVLRRSLKPAVLVAYEREPFVGLHDPTLRVTFDTGLRGRFTSRLSRLGAEAPVPVLSRHFILEVKFDHHFPGWLRPELARLGAQRRALSKYVMTLDACARATHGRRASFAGGRQLRPGLLQTSF